jgi:dolichol-phosphate mannosyltransferase
VQVLVELKATGFKKIVVIDGKSTDRTIQVALENGANVIMQNSKGKGNAVKEVLAIDYMDIDCVVLMDADGSMSPKEIPLLVQSGFLGRMF